jgi:predicted nucleic acid-binding protein
VIVAEIVYVLSGKGSYALDRVTVRDLLLPVLTLPGLDFPGKTVIRRVFDLYVSYPIDFNDAFHAALVETRAPAELFSYDQDFDRIPTVTRLEP